MAINLNNYVKQEIKTSYAIKVGDIFSDIGWSVKRSLDASVA